MEATPTPQSTRRRKVTKFALAGVAVLGVGAALTSAAWSDNVFFAGNAAAAEFELQGSVDGVNWFNADSAGGAISIPITELQEVGPGVTDSVEVFLRNAGDIDIFLNTAPTVFSTSGALFSGSLPADITFTGYGDTILEETNDETSFEIRVTGDAGWTGTAYQGATGSLVVQVQGSSSAP